MLSQLFPFAQSVVPDPSGALAGNSGWAGAGILGGLLLWLLFWHLPNKDKREDLARDKLLEQTKGMTDSFAVTVRSVGESHAATIKELTTIHSAAVKEIMARQEQQVAVLTQRHEAQVALQRADYKEMIRMVTEHCAKESEDNRKSMEGLRDAINGLHGCTVKPK